MPAVSLARHSLNYWWKGGLGKHCALCASKENKGAFLRLSTEHHRVFLLTKKVKINSKYFSWIQRYFNASQRTIRATVLIYSLLLCPTNIFWIRHGPTNVKEVFFHLSHCPFPHNYNVWCDFSLFRHRLLLARGQPSFGRQLHHRGGQAQMWAKLCMVFPLKSKKVHFKNLFLFSFRSLLVSPSIVRPPPPPQRGGLLSVRGISHAPQGRP